MDNNNPDLGGNRSGGDAQDDTTDDLLTLAGAAGLKGFTQPAGN